VRPLLPHPRAAAPRSVRPLLPHPRAAAARGVRPLLLAALAALAAAGCSSCEGAPATIGTGAGGSATGAPETARPAAGTAPPATKAPPLSAGATGRPDFAALEKPHVTLADLRVEGPLDAARARAAVALHLTAADACYAARVADKPGLRGTLEVKLDLAPGTAGAPAMTCTAATVMHSGGDAALQACVADAFRAWDEDVAAAPGGAGALSFRLTLYGGLRLPATMPALPPPPALPGPAHTTKAPDR